MDRGWRSSPTATGWFALVLRSNVAHLLPRVAAPTLVLHSRGDAPCPFEQGLMLARGIPNARFVALESRNNVILSHEPAWQRFVDEVCAFLDDNGSSISA